jgi:hypothetical protein
MGVILFELLTGERPFRGSLRVILSDVLETEPPRPRDLNRHVPRDLQTICLKCLEKDPRQRYPTAAALADDLRRFLDGKPVCARPTPALVRAGRWCRRNLAVTCMGGAMLAVLVFALFATSMLWVRAEKNAQREQQLRLRVETLTKELLQVTDQIRQLESRPSAHFDRSSAFKSAGQLPPAGTALGGARKVAAPSSEPRVPKAFLEAETEVDVESAQLAVVDDKADALRAEVQRKLRELQRLAPAIAEQYQKLAD